MIESGASSHTKLDLKKTILSPRILSSDEHRIDSADISPNALNILNRLHENGYRACLVGGAVRDLMLKRKPKDFDIATDASPEDVKALFRNSRLIGRRFRLAHVFFGREILEVATFRAPHHEAEVHTDAHSEEDTGRIVRDNVFGTIEQDVWRRDFTVNSLYYDIADATVLDYTGGIDDLDAGVLSIIGDTETRYREDSVRMLRAVRFAAKLGFSIDAKSEAAIFDLHDILEHASAARLFEEFLKLMHSGHAVESFTLLRKYQLFNHLFPLTGKVLDNEEDGAFEQFILNALENTDKRIAQNKPVTPAYIVAVLLWMPVETETNRLIKAGMIPAAALQKASQSLFSEQVRHVAVPRRFSTMSKEIWDLQARLLQAKGKRVQRVAQHPRFRAGYDFLCLRAQSFGDQQLEQKCQWWTEFQTTDSYQQALANRPPPKHRNRRPPRKRKGSKKDA